MPQAHHWLSSRHSVFCASFAVRAGFVARSRALRALQRWPASRPSAPGRARFAPDSLRMRCLRVALRRHGGSEIQARFRTASNSSPNFEMTDGQWESLMIPINWPSSFAPASRTERSRSIPARRARLNRCCRSTHGQRSSRAIRVCIHSSPTSRLCSSIAYGHAHGLTRAEYYIAPIDECYKLVGLIRTNWKGLSGGTEVWDEVGRFFAELRNPNPRSSRRRQCLI